MNNKLIKLSFLNKKVIVNKEKKTCVVSLEAKPILSTPKIISHLQALIMLSNLCEKYNIYYDITNPFQMTITAKAKCTDGDAFDELTGIRIAESKAKIKAYNLCLHFNDALYCELYKPLTDSGFTAHTYNSFIDTEEQHIIDLQK